MVTWKFKSCPKCGGDLFLDKDVEGWYEQCLQCSHRHELRAVVEMKEHEPVLKEGNPSQGKENQKVHSMRRGTS